MEILTSSATWCFSTTFGRSPTVLAVAPGRVNFIGEHTDYNDGWVMPMAIDRRTVVAAGPNGLNVARVHSAWAAEPVEIDLDGPIRPAPPVWSQYVRGVIAGIARRGTRIPGFDAVIVSDVPVGAGLSSSAALEVAVATLLEALTGHALDPVGKAVLCQQAEQEFAGVPCGVMDQFVSTLGRAGHLLLLDCRTREWRNIPWPDSMRLLVIDSGVRHELAAGEYARRKRECAEAAAALGVQALRDATLERLWTNGINATLERRARHVISENDRTIECAAALERGDWSEVGRLMFASHASLRDDFEVSCPELDALVELASELGPRHGIHGARLTGGGFGGSVIALVECGHAGSAGESIASMFATRYGSRPDVFVTMPAEGARTIQVG